MPGDKNLNAENNLAQQSYWDNSYADYHFQAVPKDDVIRVWIEKFVPDAGSGSCFEAGCFPGRYLAIFAAKGYEVNGIDLTPRVTDELPEWFKNQGYRCGLFQRQDFFQFNTSTRFNVVCSFGFIEHFKNWKEVIAKHADLTADNGYVVIVTPNFKGVLQQVIHRYLDSENLKRHYLPSMNPRKWKKILAAHGFEIAYAGYIGTFDFWVDKAPQSFFKKLIYHSLHKYKSLISRFAGTGSFASPYIGIVAKKNSTANRI